MEESSDDSEHVMKESCIYMNNVTYDYSSHEPISVMAESSELTSCIELSSIGVDQGVVYNSNKILHYSNSITLPVLLIDFFNQDYNCCQPDWSYIGVGDCYLSSQCEGRNIGFGNETCVIDLVNSDIELMLRDTDLSLEGIFAICSTFMKQYIRL